MAFLESQPLYARHNIPIFPVHITADGIKRPAIRHYQRVGLPGSAKLTRQFGDAQAFGFICGERSRITVLDIDTPDERVLADAQSRHGKSPLVVRTARKRFQVYHRHNGESRQIRPYPDRPIDILGGGFVVAPDSRGPQGQYEIIEGSLDDLDRLPRLANLNEQRGNNAAQMTVGSGRNNFLFRQLSREAHACDNFDALLIAHKQSNDDFDSPLPDDEVVRCTKSSWKMTIEGRNRFGQHGVSLSTSDVDRLVVDPHLFALLSWLKAHHGPTNTFWVANGLQEKLGWPRRQLKLARQRAIDRGWLVQLSPARRGSAALYGWGPASNRRSLKEGLRNTTHVYVENSLPDLVPHSVEAQRGDSA